ncbi:hypothetical protein [Nitrosomonas sp.]|uniref:hypothetical protein n=1 Tax=Nitrosomonas sp. TaxID=42353 RepID=UPI0025FEBEC4|nr:hypothetical protein [Nitrosomonas sp.]MCC6917184.1 hypothetical protein [Nitrosomonas sp.]
MSEEKIQGQTGQIITGEQVAAAPQPARRRLLKSTVAIPVIMTLHSGAALARSSNLVGAVDAGNAHQVDGKYVCVNGATPVENGSSTYDLGEPPVATLSLEDSSENCLNNGGILISSAAYTSLSGKGVFLPGL